MFRPLYCFARQTDFKDAPEHKAEMSIKKIKIFYKDKTTVATDLVMQR